MVSRVEEELLGVSIRRGDGGLNTRDHPVEIEDNEFASLINMEPRRAGLLKTRPGNVTVGLATVGALACHGMGAFRSPADTDLLMAAFGSTIYKWDGTATIDAVTGVSIPSTGIVRFCQAVAATIGGPSDYRMYAITPTGVAVYWDGTSAATAPNVVRGSDAIFWLNRLWVTGNPTMRGIVFPSSIGDPNAFNLSDGYFAGDGDPTQRIFNYFDQGLIVFMKHSIWWINVDQAAVGGGFTTETSTINVINREIGTVAPESVVQAGRDFFFLSRWGVHRMTKTELDRQSGLIEPISDKIRDTIDRINWVYASKAVGIVWDNKYILSVPLDASTVNSHSLVYDIRSGYWAIESGNAAGACVISDVSGQDEEYFGSPGDVGKVYKGFTGTTDSGATIVCSAESKRFNFGEPFTKKVFEYIEIEASSEDTEEYTVSAQVEDSGYVELGTETVEQTVVQVPINLPFVLGSTSLTRRRWPLRQLGDMREVQIKIEVDATEELSIVGMNLTGYLQQERLGDGSRD